MEGDGGIHRCAPAGHRFDLKSSSELFHAAAHARQSITTSGAIVRVEPGAVVDDVEADSSGLKRQRDDDPAGPSVSSSIGHGFLGDTKYGHIDARRKLPRLAIDTNLDHWFCVRPIVAAQQGEGGRERAIVEFGGRESAHQSTGILHTSTAEYFNAIDLGENIGRFAGVNGVPSTTGGEQDRRESLGQRVMDFTIESFPLGSRSSIEVSTCEFITGGEQLIEQSLPFCRLGDGEAGDPDERPSDARSHERSRDLSNPVPVVGPPSRQNAARSESKAGARTERRDGGECVRDGDEDRERHPGEVG